MKSLLLVVLLLISTYIFGSVYNGQIQKMKQPDGTRVDLRLFGSEFYIRAESLDGYTLIRDEKGWISYANLAQGGMKFVSTGERYFGKEGDPSSLKVPKNIPKHLELHPEAMQEIIDKNSLALSGGNIENLKRPGHAHFHGTPVHPIQGKIKGLALVVDFSDEPATVPFSEFEGFLNDTNYTGFGNNGSLRSYYRDVSGGVVDYENVVVGYFRAPFTFAHYNSLPMGQGATQIIKWVLDSLENQGFDFTTLTVNEDSIFGDIDNSILALNLIYTGNPPNWAQGMWFHRGVYSGFTSASGIKTFDYNTSSANSPLTLGIIAHENGHMLGKWPDTYKINSTSGPDGIGAFDLMCWYGNAFNPVPPNPLFRRNAGWGKYVDVSNWNSLILDTANSGTTYKYNNPSDTNEFYLFENRRKTGRSADIPDEGLTIWHIDRNGNNQTRHHEVRLVKANNDSVNYDSACFRAVFKPEFSQSTNPESSWNSGDASGLKLWAIGPRADIMNYKIGAGEPSSNIKLKDLGITDHNNNGFAEGGESMILKCEVSNPGQLASGICILTCSSIGTNASLVSIVTTGYNLGVLSVDSIVTKLFEIQISPLAQAGDEVFLKIEIQDGSQSLSVTRKILIGEQFNMVELTDSTCDALYYDPNGNEVYENNSDFTQTIYPSGSGQQKLQVQFLEFSLQNSTNCVSDYLNIYDGPNDTYPLLGTWCGSNLPGTLTSTDTTGALTFVFHSDNLFLRPGWKARLSCVTLTSVNQEILSQQKPVLFPNPGNGLFHFSNPDKIRSIRVFNSLGKELNLPKSSKGFHEGIDLRSIEGHIFLFQIETNHGLFAEKGFK
jgi:M6 family metalloprotease-like protein